MIPGTRPVNLCNDKSSRVKVQFWPFLARDSRRSRTVNKFSNRISSRRTSSLQAREWRRVCMECRVECIPPQALNTPETSQNDMATNWSHLVTNDAMMTVSTVSFHQFSPRNSQALSIAAIATESALDGWSWIAQRQSRAFSHLGRLLGSCEERHIYGITMRHHVQQIGMLQRIDVWTFGQCVEIKPAGQTLVELCSCESDKATQRCSKCYRAQNQNVWNEMKTPPRMKDCGANSKLNEHENVMIMMPCFAILLHSSATRVNSKRRRRMLFLLTPWDILRILEISWAWFKQIQSISKSLKQ